LANNGKSHLPIFSFTRNLTLIFDFTLTGKAKPRLLFPKRKLAPKREFLSSDKVAY